MGMIPALLLLVLVLLCVCLLWLWRLDAAFNREKLRIYGAAIAAVAGLHGLLQERKELLADTPKQGKELFRKLFDLFKLDSSFLWASPEQAVVIPDDAAEELVDFPRDSYGVPVVGSHPWRVWWLGRKDAEGDHPYRLSAGILEYFGLVPGSVEKARLQLLLTRYSEGFHKTIDRSDEVNGPMMQREV